MTPSKVEVIDSENGRVYLVNGREYISVTTPLSILAMPYLEIWRARKGKKVADSIAAKAAAQGSTIHSYIDKICNGKEVEIAYKYSTVMGKFQEWFAENVIKVWETEKVVWSDKYMVGGRYDFLGEIKGYDGLTIIDWKSGRIKKEHFLQLAAYRHLTYERNKKIKLSDIKRRLVVQVKDDEVKEVWPEKEKGIDTNIDRDWEVYLSLLTVYNWYKEKKK